MEAIFKVPAFIIYVVGGIWGFFISLGIVTDALGFIGGAIAYFLAPFALAFAPWYAAIADNNWLPVGLVYGGGIAASILWVKRYMSGGKMCQERFIPSAGPPAPNCSCT